MSFSAVVHMITVLPQLYPLLELALRFVLCKSYPYGYRRKRLVWVESVASRARGASYGDCVKIQERLQTLENGSVRN